MSLNQFSLGTIFGNFPRVEGSLSRLSGSFKNKPSNLNAIRILEHSHLDVLLEKIFPLDEQLGSFEWPSKSDASKELMLQILFA